MTYQDTKSKRYFDRWLTKDVDYRTYHRNHARLRVVQPANHCENDVTHVAKKYEWANITGVYDDNPKNYRQLCRSCHAKLDMTDKSRLASGKRALGNGWHNKAVAQYDKQGRLISTYKSLVTAHKATGILRTSITNNLTGLSKSAGGYKWRYAND